MTLAIDIGSTMVKLSRLDETPIRVESVARDREAGIEAQVKALMARYGDTPAVRICSSANGGLRAGIFCLTRRFSGLVVHNIASAAGCNVAYLREYRDGVVDLPEVDVLILTGGAGDEPVAALSRLLDGFDLRAAPHQALIWAGGAHAAKGILESRPEAIIADNPLGDDLRMDSPSLAASLSRLYLDDLVHKEGIAALQSLSETPIWPTPAVVNLAHRRIASRAEPFDFPTPFILIDIGGATTDVHFGIELRAPEMVRLEDVFPDDCRWVFIDLGVCSSRASTLDRLGRHPKLMEFLHVLAGDKAHVTLDALHMGEAEEDLLFHACFFLALAELIDSDDADVPKLAIERAAAIVVTGGGSQCTDPDVLARLVAVLLGPHGAGPRILFDTDYAVWTAGIRAVPARADAPQKIVAP